MAPEQVAGSREVDHRADIYSLGCTFVFLLTGKDPDPVVLASSGADRFPEVPPALLPILTRMLAAKPDDRFQTMADVEQALEQWLALPEEHTARKETPRPPRATGHRVWLLAALLTGVVLTVVSVWLAWPPSHDKNPSVSDSHPALRLLDAVQLPQDVIAGVWQKDGDALTVSHDQFSRISLAAAPQGDYEFHVRFIRDHGHDGEICLFLPIADQKTCAAFLGRGNKFGLENNADHPLIERPHPAPFRNGEPHSVCCRVRHSGDAVKITMDCDGVALLAWEGPAETFSPRQAWLIPRNSLGLGSHENQVRFEAANLVMLNGSARQFPASTALGWHAADEGWHDLLSLVDVPNHTIFGKWKREQGAMRADAGDYSRLQIPVIPLGGYEVKMEWERLSGAQEEVLILPAGESPFGLRWFMLSLPNNDWLGINDLDPQTYPTARRSRKVEEFQVGKVSTALVCVQPVGDQVEITLTVNEQPGIQWSGPISELKVPEEWKIQPHSMAIGVHGDSVLFRHLSIRRLSGKLLKVLRVDRVPVLVGGKEM